MLFTLLYTVVSCHTRTDADVVGEQGLQFFSLKLHQPIVCLAGNVICQYVTFEFYFCSV